MRYFRIVDSFALRDRWYLGDPLIVNGVEIDPRLFTKGKVYTGDKIVEVPITKGTKPLDFTLASFDMPVAKTQIVKLIQALGPDSIQRIPIDQVDGISGYEIINVTTVLECINEQHSEITRWTEADGIPGKIGKYFGIGKLVLNIASITGYEIFRIKNWQLPLIVSGLIKESLEKANTSGIAFEEMETL